jgi:hypothetical protein
MSMKKFRECKLTCECRGCESYLECKFYYDKFKPTGLEKLIETKLSMENNDIDDEI